MLIREELFEDYERDKLSYNEYKRELKEILSDKPRSGTPPIFTRAQIDQIVTIGSTKPEELGLPFTHWSNELLKQEVVSREIVKSISTRQVGRFLKSAPSSTA